MSEIPLRTVGIGSLINENPESVSYFGVLMKTLIISFTEKIAFS